MGTPQRGDCDVTTLHAVAQSVRILYILAATNANLEEVAEASGRHGRYEFMLSIGALRLRNVTGSPVNPIAIF